MSVGVRGRGIGAGCAAIVLLPGVFLAAAADDIRGIRGPEAVPGSWEESALLAGATIAMLCFAYVIRRWLRRSAPVLSLSKSTLRRLEGTRTLMRPHTARAFGVSASEVIRDYIEKRFDVVATRQTTEEFLHAVLQSSNQVLARHRPSLAQFLQQCDFVKFARGSLAVNEMESLLQSARCFVLETGDLPITDDLPAT